ncbi:hypothetical protein RKD37_003196 [Streptomyces ambofaciens]
MLANFSVPPFLASEALGDLVVGCVEAGRAVLRTAAAAVVAASAARRRGQQRGDHCGSGQSLLAPP